MAKRSKQRPVQQKKDQIGCMWGLFSLFDFRHGRTTKRLLSDRRKFAANETYGSPYPTSEENLPTNSEEMHIKIEDGGKIKNPSFDLVRTSVKELIDEEMFVDQDPKNQNNNNKIKSESGSHKLMERTSKRSFDQGFSISNQDSDQKLSQHHDLEALVKEMLLIYQIKHEQHDDLDTGAKRSFPIAEEKLIAAVEVLLNEKSTNGDDKKTHHLKEMLQMLSSNKETFLKLLQDQNSVDQKSKSKSMASSNLLEPESTDRDPEDPPTHKHRKFFRRKSKSQENISLSGIGKDRIVILKPGSPENQIRMENEIHSEGNASQFSFMEIKRRLKQAIGKEQRTLGASEKSGKSGFNDGWSSPNRDHFYTERFARVTNRLKMGDRNSKLRESELKNEDANRQISNIYVEAKKHLSEMLTSGDEDAELTMRNLPKSLGRFLSLREYNSLSPGTSPKAQTRPFFENLHMVNKSQPSTTSDNSQEKIVDADEITSEEVQEIVKSPSSDKENEEQLEGFSVSCEPCGSSNGVDENYDGMIFDGIKESLKLDFPDENELSSSRTPLPASKNEELEIIPDDRTGKPSPISILEPLFSDDDITPARTVSWPVEAAVQPLRIRFDDTVSPAEDQQIRITDSADNEESAFEYVEAVLLSSDLNWFEFEKQWLSSDQILDPSFFDEVEAFSGRARYDQRLLFDSANEGLEEVCDRFIPESSLIKPSVWPVPKGMDLINEVWSRLEPRISKIYPRDPEKLVRYDLETSRMWMDPRAESRHIVIKIEESIFEETIDDTLLSLFDGFVHGEILDDRTNSVRACS